MIKLLKILNSASNVPEPIMLPVNPNNYISEGTPLILDSYGYVNALQDSERVPEYIAFANSQTGKFEMLVYPITSDMVFEMEHAHIEDMMNATPPGQYTVISYNSSTEKYYIDGAVNGGYIHVLALEPDRDRTIFQFKKGYVHTDDNLL